jgi:hypothetical protein
VARAQRAPSGHSVCFCRFDVADTNSVGFRVRTRRF